MTTIIIIVVVALVFFITICVVTFVVWKRESQLRTDSIQAIEQNLEKLNQQLSSDILFRQTRARQVSQAGRAAVRRDKDPFGWVKEESSQEIPEMQKEPERSRDDDNDQSNDTEETEDFTDRFPKAVPEQFPEIGANRTERQADLQDRQWEPRDGQSNVPDKQLDLQDGQWEPRDGQSDVPDKQLDLANQQWDFPEIELPEVGRDFPEIDIPEYQFESLSKGPSEYNVGRSGREYTATELETLIKE